MQSGKALLSLSLLCAVVAVAVAPPTPGTSAGSGPAWPEAVARVVDLGRDYAGADVAWLKTVQIMGSDKAAQTHYPHLEDWVDLCTSLDPKLSIAYAFGAILLVTESDRAARVDELLARGEAALPDDFSLSMDRGFVAYFGRLDAAAAAGHYERAARKPGAPAYLNAFAARLRKRVADCRDVMQDLGALAAQGTKRQAEAMAGQQRNVVESCTKATLEHAAQAYKTARGKSATTVADLVEAGIVESTAVWQPRDQCWTLSHEHATLGACPR